MLQGRLTWACHFQLCRGQWGKQVPKVSNWVSLEQYDFLFSLRGGKVLQRWLRFPNSTHKPKWLLESFVMALMQINPKFVDYIFLPKHMR